MSCFDGIVKCQKSYFSDTVAYYLLFVATQHDERFTRAYCLSHSLLLLAAFIQIKQQCTYCKKN